MLSRWACESMSTGICGAALFEARAHLHLFEESGENRLAVFADGCGDDHAIGFEAAKFAWSEVGDDDDFAANEGFRLVGFGYACEDLTLFVAEIYFETKKLVGPGDPLGNHDLCDAEFDFAEVVDGDGLSLRSSTGCCLGGCGSARALFADGCWLGARLLRDGRCYLCGRGRSRSLVALIALLRIGAASGARRGSCFICNGGCLICCLRGVLVFDVLHLCNRVLFCAGEYRAEFGKFRARRELGPGEISQVCVGDVAESKLLPDACRAVGNDWVDERSDDADGFRRRVKNVR